jgi:hypothetical protein
MEQIKTFEEWAADQPKNKYHWDLKVGYAVYTQEINSRNEDVTRAQLYYQNFAESLPETKRDAIRKFKISYTRGYAESRVISGMEICFAGPDARAETSPANGHLGGRPRMENPSPNALRMRKRRESAQTQTYDRATRGHMAEERLRDEMP